MDWQQAVALSIVALTAGVFAWNRWRPRKFNFGSDSACGGCGGGTQLGPAPTIKLKARKGQRPEVFVKMK